MKRLLIGAALAALALAASAGNLIGDTTNNVPIGVGVGVGLGGAGGSVLGSGNSANLNANSNLQGQQQGQAQSSRNSNRNVSGSNSVANGGNSDARAFGGSGGDSSNSVSVGGDVTNIPRTAASAAPVYVNSPSADVCQRSGFGASLQGPGGGGAISFGGSESETCETRADAVNLKFTGAPEAVIRARQCQNPKIAKAFEDAGVPCKSGSKVASAGAPLPATAGVAKTSEPTDPFIRARLGLPARN